MRAILALASCLSVLAIPAMTRADSLFLTDLFVRSGQSESIIAPLTVFGGVTTTLTWSGLVEMTVSNVGVRDPNTGNMVDAFYEFGPSNSSVPTPINTTHGLRVSFAGCAAAIECAAPTILRVVRFVDQVGFVSPVPNWPLDPGSEAFAVMPYSAAHAYHYVVDFGPIPGFLTLGDGDGLVFDNSGQFDITLYSVTPTPEPSVMFLLSSSFVLVGGTAAFRRLEMLRSRS